MAATTVLFFEIVKNIAGAFVNPAAIDCYILPDVVVAESLTAGATSSWSFDQAWKELIPMN